MRRWFIFLTIGGAALGAAIFVVSRSQNRAIVEAQLVAHIAASSANFAQATGPIELSFPEAHGPHPEYQTEWWYFTGNLEDEAGRRFGYQFTLFRRALTPSTTWEARDSAWGTEQVYMAHFTITDVTGEEHFAYERLSRGGAELAGAQAEPFRIWLEDWSVEADEADSWRIIASDEDIMLDLLVEDLKGPVLQGERGYSQKGPEPGNASYYYSLTRMDTQGQIGIDGQAYKVAGLSWMDHEYSTSALAADQIGWDWFSIQLDDNSELMLYYVRRADGSIDLLSQGTYISPAAETQRLSYGSGDYSIAVMDTWRSTFSGGEYPVAWVVDLPALDMTLEIDALLDDQENRLSYAYWEGAVDISGQRSGVPITGVGYVEMTGYATSMAGQF